MMVVKRTAEQSQKIRERAAGKLGLNQVNRSTREHSISRQLAKPVKVSKNDPLVKRMIGTLWRGITYFPIYWVFFFLGPLNVFLLMLA